MARNGAAGSGRSAEEVSPLDKRIIERLQVVGVTDTLKLGFRQMAMVAIRCDGARLTEIADEIATFPEVSYVVITAGTYDLLVETVCEDTEALLRILTERIRRVAGVRDTETFVYLRMVKQAFQWGTR